MTDTDGEQLANIIFATIQDRRGRTILSVRDQNTFAPELRRKRLMTLLHLFLIHRYQAAAIHYLTPTDDNRRQCERMLSLGIFEHGEGRGGRDHRGRDLGSGGARPGPS